MKLTSTSIFFVFLAAFSFFAWGCGGGSSSAGKAANVLEVDTDDPSVHVNDDVDLSVQFTFSTDTVVHDNHNVLIIVRIPNGLQYETSTARIDEIGGTDSVDPATTETCSNGDTFLKFNLGQNVLANASDPDGPQDGKLIMALLGTQAVGAVTIEAVAAYDFEPISGSCSEGIVPEEVAVFTVLR